MYQPHIMQENHEDNTANTIRRHVEFSGELTKTTSDLRFDICPALFKNPIKEIVFSGRNRIIAGEIPSDELKLSKRVIEAVTESRNKIKIIDPAHPEHAIKFIFTNEGKKKHLIIDKQFALYNCKALADILQAEEMSDEIKFKYDEDGRNIIQLNLVEYDTMKHIFLILYNPGLYFYDEFSCVRLFRRDRFHRIMHASNLLGIDNIKHIMSTSIGYAFKLYEVIRHDYFDIIVSEFVCRQYRNAQTNTEPTPDVIELVEKIKERKNIAVKYEIVGVKRLFATICEFIPEISKQFACSVLKLNKSDNSSGRIIVVRNDGNIPANEIMCMLDELRPPYSVCGPIIAILFDKAKKDYMSELMRTTNMNFP